MKAFRFLFMLIGLMLFSTGIRASTSDQKESLKTVVAFDVGTTIKVEIFSPALGMTKTTVLATVPSENIVEQETSAIKIESRFPDYSLKDYETTLNQEPDYHRRC